MTRRNNAGITPDEMWGTRGVLYNFDLEGGGTGLPAPPAPGPNGSFYCSVGGGPGAFGAFVQLQPPSVPGGTWTQTILYNYAGFVGVGPLVTGPRGVFYGTNLGGAIAQLTPPAAPGGSWTETILYTLTRAQGLSPNSLTLASDGTLYGTAFGGNYEYGGGDTTVFQLTPPASSPCRALCRPSRCPTVRRFPPAAFLRVSPVGRTAPFGSPNGSTVRSVASPTPAWLPTRTRSPAAAWAPSESPLGPTATSGSAIKSTTTAITAKSDDSLQPARFTMYPIPYPGLPSSITTGPAGAVWFTGITYVGRITTAGAITMWQMIDRARVTVIPDLERIVVAIDPAATAREDSDETGIVICGKGVDGHAYVLKDLSCRLSPEGWARRAITGYREFHADRMVAEVNNGGDMVESTVRMVDANVSFRKLTRWMPSFPGSGERSGAANRRRRY